MHASRAPRRILRAATAACLVASLAVAGLSTSSAAPSQSELDAAKARLQELEREFEIVVEEYNLVNARLEGIQAEMSKTASTVSSLEKRMNGRQDEAVELAIQIYKSGGATGSIEAILSSKSLADMDTSIEYLKTGQEAQTEVFQRLKAAQQELDVELERLEGQRKKVDDAREELLALKAQIEEKVASQQDEVRALVEKIQRAEERARRAAAAAAKAAHEPPPPPPIDQGNIPHVDATNPNAQKAVDAALSQVGKPYVYAAAGPDSYDCSGLTMWAWAQAGVSLPHNSGMQYAATPRIALSDLEPGDLMFFGSPIHHVSMYIGNGQMVEAPYTGEYVRVVSSSRTDFVGAGRPGI